MIIVNDGSTVDMEDQIKEIGEVQPTVQYLQNTNNNGKGYTLRKGLRHGKSMYSMFTDIDFPYTLPDTINVIKTLIFNDIDVVVCSRNSTYYSHLNFQRRIISGFIHIINKLFFSLPTHDTQGGLKALNQAGKEIYLQTKANRYLSDLEFIKKVGKSNLRLRKVEVNLKENIQIPPIRFHLLLKEIPSFIRILLS